MNVEGLIEKEEETLQFQSDHYIEIVICILSVIVVIVMIVVVIKKNGNNSASNDNINHNDEVNISENRERALIVDEKNKEEILETEKETDKKTSSVQPNDSTGNEVDEFCRENYILISQIICWKRIVNDSDSIWAINDRFDRDKLLRQDGDKSLQMILNILKTIGGMLISQGEYIAEMMALLEEEIPSDVEGSSSSQQFLQIKCMKISLILEVLQLAKLKLAKRNNALMDKLMDTNDQNENRQISLLIDSCDLRITEYTNDYNSCLLKIAETLTPLQNEQVSNNCEILKIVLEMKKSGKNDLITPKRFNDLFQNTKKSTYVDAILRRVCATLWYINMIDLNPQCELRVKQLYVVKVSELMPEKFIVSDIMGRDFVWMDLWLSILYRVRETNDMIKGELNSITLSLKGKTYTINKLIQETTDQIQFYQQKREKWMLDKLKFYFERNGC